MLCDLKIRNFCVPTEKLADLTVCDSAVAGFIYAEKLPEESGYSTEEAVNTGGVNRAANPRKLKK